METLRSAAREVALDVLALLWPTQCVVCEHHDRDLCDGCRADLQAREHRVGRARASLRHGLEPSTRNGDDPGIDLFVNAPYSGALRDVIVAYKHGGATGFARLLGRHLSAPLLAALALAGGDHDGVPPLIVPVPSRPTRVRQRGFRHVDLILRSALAALPPGTAVPVLPALRTLRGRTGQVGLSPACRRENGARIAVRRRFLETLRGRRIVLVDDIVTTGATLLGAHARLTSAGAETVVAAALAVTAPRNTEHLVPEWRMHP